MNFSGIAELITALTGVVSLIVSVIVFLRVGKIHTLTNSNFAKLQAALNESLAWNERQQQEAARIAERTISTGDAQLDAAEMQADAAVIQAEAADSQAKTARDEQRREREKETGNR